MALTDTERALLRRAQNRLEEWKFEARDRAYAELFGGGDAAVSEAELATLDRIDSELTRASGTGLWDADEYGIVATGSFDRAPPEVVCTYHPEIPFEGYRGEGSLSDETRDELNDVLWEYAERVAELVQAELTAFLREARADG
jgi:hypothetical protein